MATRDSADLDPGEVNKLVLGGYKDEDGMEVDDDNQDDQDDIKDDNNDDQDKDGKEADDDDQDDQNDIEDDDNDDQDDIAEEDDDDQDDIEGDNEAMEDLAYIEADNITWILGFHYRIFETPSRNKMADCFVTFG